MADEKAIVKLEADEKQDAQPDSQSVFPKNGTMGVLIGLSEMDEEPNQTSSELAVVTRAREHLPLVGDQAEKLAQYIELFLPGARCVRVSFDACLQQDNEGALVHDLILFAVSGRTRQQEERKFQQLFVGFNPRYTSLPHALGVLLGKFAAAPDLAHQTAIAKEIGSILINP